MFAAPTRGRLSVAVTRSARGETALIAFFRVFSECSPAVHITQTRYVCLRSTNLPLLLKKGKTGGGVRTHRISWTKIRSLVQITHFCSCTLPTSAYTPGGGKHNRCDASRRHLTRRGHTNPALQYTTRTAPPNRLASVDRSLPSAKKVRTNKQHRGEVWTKVEFAGSALAIT